MLLIRSIIYLLCYLISHLLALSPDQSFTRSVTWSVIYPLCHPISHSPILSRTPDVMLTFSLNHSLWLILVLRLFPYVSWIQCIILPSQWEMLRCTLSFRPANFYWWISNLITFKSFSLKTWQHQICYMSMNDINHIH